MARLCEVCGATDDRAGSEMTSFLMHVCESCIRDRAPYEHSTPATENTAIDS